MLTPSKIVAAGFVITFTSSVALISGIYIGERRGFPLKEYFPNAVLFQTVRCFPSIHQPSPPDLKKITNKSQ